MILLQRMTLPRILKRGVLLFFIASVACHSTPYYGSAIGNLNTVSNDIKGEVFVIDDNTLFIKGFSYDGHSEDAVFWAGSSDSPDSSGFIIPSDGLSYNSLPAYNNHDIILSLPEKKSVKDIRWMAIWNRNLSQSLGSLVFPNSIPVPHAMAIGPLVNTKEGISTGDILILDTQTFLVPELNYDGSNKEVYWWISKGTKPSEDGIRLQENGSDEPLHRSLNSTVVVILPKAHSILDYDTLSIWSTTDGYYGFVDIPKNLHIPPSLRTLGKEELGMDEFNCEMLNDNLGLEVRWLITGDDIILHLVGNIGPSEYMSLGLSKDDTETKFDSADAVVAGIDSQGKKFAVDYFFESNEKCHNGQGMCPDYIYGASDDLKLLETEKTENSTVIIFKRHLKADDKVYDQSIFTDGPQAILWAVGRLDSDDFVDTPILKSRGNLLLDFGREPNWNCPPPKKNLPSNQLKEKPQRIHCPSDRTFRAQIGSSPRSTVKNVWFINGLPTPQLTVQRGNTYTFIVEGGLNPPFHHPFYITSSKEGGMYQSILEGTDPAEHTFAGVEQDAVTGNIYPTAEGRFCIWKYSDTDHEYSVINSNQEVKSTLVLKCEPGEPGKLVWTPDIDTPDTVYYQSFKERNLGGEIKVLNFCEETNPHRYLETQTKGGRPPIHPTAESQELEREVENVFGFYSNLKHERNLNAAETAEHILSEFNYPAENDKYTLPNTINSVGKLAGSRDENFNVANIKHGRDENVTSAPLLQVSEGIDSEILFPHDESERSDAYIPNREIPKESIRNKESLNAYGNSDVPVKQPAYSSESSNIPSPMTQILHEFKPQFEGGFIPLVMNPMKEKEFVQIKELTSAHLHRGRPHRQFLYNESVPFHGTFKPGVPDFSGFNISHYSQEDDSIIIASNPENLSILSAMPQPIREPFPSAGAIPLPLLQNYNIPPQRAQEFFHMHRQQHLPFAGRKNLLPPLEFNRKPNNPIRDEDLAGVPSQRIYVSLQAPGDKQPQGGNVHKQHLSDVFDKKHTHQNLQHNKAYPPPIQRRPDFHETREINFHLSPPHLKYNQQLPPNIRNNNQQKMSLPSLQTSRLQTRVNSRPQMQSSKFLPENNLPVNRQQIRAPTGQMQQHPYHQNAPLRDGLSHVPPIISKGIPTRPPALPNRDFKVSNIFLNHPHNSGERFHLPLHIINLNEKNPEKLHEITNSKEHNLSPKIKNVPSFLTNSETGELIKETQAYANQKSMIHPDFTVQKAHSKESLNIFNFDNIDVSNSHVSSVATQPKLNERGAYFKNISYPSASPYKIKIVEGNSKKEEISTGQIQSYSTNPVTITPHIELYDNNSNKIQKHEAKEYKAPLKIDLINLEHQKNMAFQAAASVFSSSESTKLEETSHLTHECDSPAFENDSSLTDTDYNIDHLPFGARLTHSQNIANAPTKPSNGNGRISDVIVKRSQVHTAVNRNKNSTKRTEFIPMRSSQTYLPSGSISRLGLDEEKHNLSIIEAESIKSLYYTPPFATFSVSSENEKTSTKVNKHSISSDNVKHILSVNEQSIFSDDVKHIPNVNDHSRPSDDVRHIPNVNEQSVSSDDVRHIPNGNEHSISSDDVRHIPNVNEHSISSDNVRHIPKVNEHSISSDDIRHIPNVSEHSISSDNVRHIPNVNEHSISADDVKHIPKVNEHSISPDDDRHIPNVNEHSISADDVRHIPNINEHSISSDDVRHIPNVNEHSISSDHVRHIPNVNEHAVSSDDVSHIPNINQHFISADIVRGIPNVNDYSVSSDDVKHIPNINEHSISSDDVKHIPIIADTLEDFIEMKHLGRKNILPNNTSSAFSNPILPPKVSENINLPQIFENLPHNDNRTNYSILDHVLALIGSPPNIKEAP